MQDDYSQKSKIKCVFHWIRFITVRTSMMFAVKFNSGSGEKFNEYTDLEPVPLSVISVFSIKF